MTSKHLLRLAILTMVFTIIIFVLPLSYGKIIPIVILILFYLILSIYDKRKNR